MATVSYPHVEVGADGAAFVAGTRTKVLEIALDRLAHQWDAEEIQRQHPGLSLGQIHSALAYYYDHHEAFDRLISQQLEEADGIASRQPPSLLRAKLAARDSKP